MEAVQSGDEIVIAKSGTPIARLVPYAPPKRRIAPPGAMKGQIWIGDDFDEPLDGIFLFVTDSVDGVDPGLRAAAEPVRRNQTRNRGCPDRTGSR